MREPITIGDPHTLLTVKDYAKLIGVHFQTVYTAIQQQRLQHPVVRVLGTNAIRIQVPASLVNKDHAA